MLRCLSLAVAVVMPVVADIVPDISGTVYTFFVDENDSASYSSVIPSSCSKVVKTGKGTLSMSGNSVDFHGNVEIQQGVVVAEHMNALGRGSGSSGTTSMNTISVWNDAQLRATFATDKSDGNSEGRGFRSFVEIAGDGPDGTGAFYYDRASNSSVPYWLIYELKLTADASIGGNIPYSARTFNLNRKTLTVKTSDYLHFYYNFVTNPGHIVAKDKVRIWGSTFNGGTTNLLTLADTASTFYLSSANPINWSVIWNYPGVGAVENNSGGGDGTRNVIKGDFTFKGTQITFWPNATDRGVTFKGSFLCENAYVNKGGTGLLAFNGPTNRMTYISLSGGTLSISNSLLLETSHIQANGNTTIRMTNVGLAVMTNGSTQLRGRRARGERPTELLLSGNTTFKNTGVETYLYPGMYVNFGSGFEKTWGTLTLGEGVTMSNNFAVGYNSWGAVYQSGGDIYWDSVSRAKSGHIGCGPYCGYGYWGMDNGTLTIPRFVTFAGDNADSTAFFVQRGGTARLTGEDLKLSTRGHANMYICNGASFTQTTGSTYMGYTDGTQGTGGDAVVTVAGTGSVFSAYWFVGMQNRQGFTSYININDGGVFETFYIVNNSGSGWTWPAGSKQYVSFNGGIWRNPTGRESRHNLFYSGDRYAPDALFCHKGGATFDTSASTCELNVPLVAPSGKVLKSVTLPTDSDFLAATNIGPVRISIEGSGVGATAFAPFDDATRTLRGDVIVTSPGSGYSSEDTVVKAWSDDGSHSWDCTYELEDASSGDLVKLGPGTLYLQCVNTYGGKTSVKAGRLEMAVAGAIPSGHALEIAAGSTLSLSNDLSVTTLEGAGRTIGGTDKTLTVTEAFVLSADDLAAAKGLSVAGTLAFAPGAKIQMEGAENLPDSADRWIFATANAISGDPVLADNFGGKWRIGVNAAGKSLTLRLVRGTTVSFR